LDKGFLTEEDIMKANMVFFVIVFLNFLVPTTRAAQEIRGLGKEEIEMFPPFTEEQESGKSQPTRVYLRKAVGNLQIDASSTTETYEAYFHIPICFGEQVPIFIEVESPQLIDYRFVHLNPPNVIIAAQMQQAPTSPLDWRAWVFVKENTYADCPDFVPIPIPQELPDSVKKWLQPTDCVQVDAAIVQQIADSIRGGTTNLIKLADDICNFCWAIPWVWPHVPFALDAVYALTWGSSCTGHAHAGAALFRANGIPARSLLNMPTWSSNYDHHWIIDYYIPDYGWVRMETSTGQHPCFAQDEIVTLACNPEDEFPLFFPSGIEGYWHTSDPELGMYNPNWGGAHSAISWVAFSDSSEKIEQAYSLTDSVFYYYSRYWGIKLTPAQQTNVQSAYDYQKSAQSKLSLKDLDGYIEDMQQALQCYREINPETLTAIFFDDFESGAQGWTHGGAYDEWELGNPSYGPADVHSGDNCWGTDLDDTYENYADCWLKSPPIDLTDLACAYLSFWVWNWVEDENQGFVYDPLWLDLSTDGIFFQPLCSHMGGVNDDPQIPDVGGWTMMVLDLTKYVGETVHIRFRFQSDQDDVQPGSYIDDMWVYGRAVSETGIEVVQIAAPPQMLELYPNYPNPFNSGTTISYHLKEDLKVSLAIYNIMGQKVRTIVDDHQKAGGHQSVWHGQDDGGSPVASGVYFCKIQAGEKVEARQLLLLR
jgi:transglutaminase-like putative cysteine protease